MKKMFLEFIQAPIISCDPGKTVLIDVSKVILIEECELEVESTFEEGSKLIMDQGDEFYVLGNKYEIAAWIEHKS